MSVAPMTWEELELIGSKVLAWHIAHDHGSKPDHIATIRDAMRAAYAAQRTAYLLTYGEPHNDPPWQYGDTRLSDAAWQRDPYAHAATGDWAALRSTTALRSLARDLQRVQYQATSNGGTQCLPAKYSQLITDWELMLHRDLAPVGL